MQSPTERALIAVAALALACASSQAGSGDGEFSAAPCAGPVRQAQARDVAIVFFAGLPFTEHYRSLPEHSTLVREEYWFLFPRAESLEPGDRIISSRSAQIFVHERTGCARHQLW